MMTELENDLTLEAEYDFKENSSSTLNYGIIAKNLSKIGYQKIVWHDVKKIEPERLKYVLGYCAEDGTFAVVKLDNTNWSDDNEICYNVDYWAELPKIKIEE